MPRNLSAWTDLVVQLTVMLVMIAVLSQYNRYLSIMAFVLWLVLAFFTRERVKHRTERFNEYCNNVVAGCDDWINYARTNLPYAVIIIDENGRMEWCNELAKQLADVPPEQGMHVDEFWQGLLDEKVLNAPADANEHKPDGVYTFNSKFTIKDAPAKSGEYQVSAKFETKEDTKEDVYRRAFQVHYRHLEHREGYAQLTALFVREITAYENLKVEYARSRTTLAYIQVDNYDEVTQGLSESEKTSLMLSVNKILDEWIQALDGFIRRVTEDLFIVVLERVKLERAIDAKFDVLDKVRQILNKNKLPVTLSMGVAIADKKSLEQSMAELGERAKSELDLALSRGGDQVAVRIDNKVHFFGGRAKAVEKHTRVKSRVVANAIREKMAAADEIFIMGHVREDFDSFGASVGVTVMARKLEKPVHLVLSESVDAISKITKYFFDEKSGYSDILVSANDINGITALNPLLVVVDTYVPNLVAAPKLLERVKQIIVIDHHRRAESYIRNTLLVYHEPAASSASELVTELLMYFDEKISIGKLAATALYSGIVVDTKQFSVQTSSRTFDAAAYLRRNGADPVVVKEVFRDDFESAVALARTKAQSEYYEGGLVVSTIPTVMPNIMAIAGQAADTLLMLENVRMTIIIYMLPHDVVGVSARSAGELNVQVIMEAFGGGGHQNAAGAQIKNTDIHTVKENLIAAAQKHIEETDAATKVISAAK